MILDSSALASVILGEDDAESMLALMSSAPELAISAATLVECAIILEARQGPEASADLEALLADLECRVLPFDEEQARLAIAAWRRFGKGRHRAALNLGDCYSYAAAAKLGEPLLCKGEDFRQTDLPLAL